MSTKKAFFYLTILTNLEDLIGQIARGFVRHSRYTGVKLGHE